MVKELKQVGPWGEKSLQDTPYQITSIPSEFIENTVSTNSSQLFIKNPTIQNAGAPGVYTHEIEAIIRGITTLDTLLDGINGSGSTNLSEVERVEILNGTSGFMYGIGNPGGKINYVLKRPTYERVTNLTLGNYGNQQWFGHLDAGNKIDEKGKFAYRLNASYQDGETSKKDQDMTKSLISGALDWNVTDNLLIQVDASHNTNEISNVNARFYTSGIPVKNNETNSPKWMKNKNESNRIGTNLEWNINDIFTLRTKYQYSEQKLKSAYNSYVDLYSDGWAVRTVKLAPSESQNHGVYAYLDSKFDTGSINHKLTFGVSGNIIENKIHEKNINSWKDGLSSINDIMNLPIPNSYKEPKFGRHYKSGESKNSNIMIGDDITFNENWSALVGVNYTTVEAESYKVDGDRQSYAKKSVATPTLSLIYKPFEELTTYATYMEALSSPTIVSSENRVNPNEVLDPLKSKQYEVGVKYSIAPDLFLSTALYKIEQDTERTEDGTWDGKIVQDGLNIYQGVELMLQGKVTDNFTLMTGGTFMDAKMKKADDHSLNGKYLDEVARKQFKIYAEYDIPFIDGLTLTGGSYWMDRRQRNIENTKQMPSYAMFDAGLRYKTKIDKYPTTFIVNGTNIFDKTVWARSGYLYEPTNIAFSMKMEF
ncbi:TonB-dependent siderophore receptor [Aliarcobacter vitoriensis]|uniref:TonB-dependent siderophore receptor n=1 Tax=Aliarcobacter vitoriensis TaxID=2011099 RepID=UPI00211D4219